MHNFGIIPAKTEAMKYLFVIGIVAGLAACQQSSTTGSTSLDTGFQSTPLVTETKPSDSLHNMDTSVMVVDSVANITFNGAPLEKKENNVYNAVYNSWMQAYQKTNHLPLAFKLVKQGTVTMGLRENIGDAVMKAQDEMKNYIAKDKFRKKFAELSSVEKDSMQNMHPVLFQKPF